ncbi:MAG: hypothetical protein IJE62_07010 [Clostridia bacterium]|nr:hypothetical protein [Clostridia bacterium]
MSLKVLVVSHNVFSFSSNMGRTLANFFKSFPCEDIAQLYFHTQVPTTDICKNYFRITDFDILKKKKSETGKRLSEADIRKDLKTERVDEGVEAQIYQFGRKRRPWMYIGRNILWGLGKWKNDRMEEWIDEFDPDIVFFASGDYTFAYKIAMWVSGYKKIPIVTYVCDDFYFLKRKSMSPLYYINRFDFKRTMKKLFKEHKETVMICDELSRDYKKEFGINPTTVMTVSDLTGKELEEVKANDNIKISYIGNLGYNRHLALAEVGRTLKDLYGGRVMIDLYSTERRPRIVKHLTEENGIAFHGAISAAEVKEVIKKTDILMHIESMDKKNRNKVRYSVSTKIADSLASGKCLFAYGPGEVASMQHLIRNECAIVATSEEELKKALKIAFEDSEKRKSVCQNAVKTAEKYHFGETNDAMFKAVLEKAAKNI